MAKIYEFKEHSLVIRGERHHLEQIAEALRDNEGTIGDLVYQMDYALDDDFRKDLAIADGEEYEEDFLDNYLVE